MPATADVRATPSIAVHWVKNNILAAIISGAASLSIYGVRHATGATDADSGFGAIAILYVAVIGLWAFWGVANGVLTGAVLQRVVPSLPVRTWIAVQVAMALVAGVGLEIALLLWPRDTIGTDDSSMLEMLLFGSILGAILGAVSGGLEALVLRKAAFGTASWIACSAVALAIAWSLLGITSSWVNETDFAGELANQARSLLVAVIASLVMLPALRRLKSPTLSKAPLYFT